MATGDFTTLADLKSYLNLNNTNDDALLARMISAGSAFLVTYLARDILSNTYSEMRNGNGSNRMMLKNSPVTAVSSITVYGQTIPSGGAAGVKTGYWFDSKQIYLYGYQFSLGHGNVVINYTAGYSTIPLDLEQVCIELVSVKFKRRQRIGEDSKDFGGQTVSFAKRDLSPDHTDLLAKYKRVVPIV